jgi:hypothetical protein
MCARPPTYHASACVQDPIAHAASREQLLRTAWIGRGATVASRAVKHDMPSAPGTMNPAGSDVRGPGRRLCGPWAAASTVSACLRAGTYRWRTLRLPASASRQPHV